jgi:hypothetical protein
MKVILIACGCLGWAFGVSAQISFVESSQQLGITHFQLSSIELGGGVAIFDMNNDGWEEIYLTGGENRDKLYRNNADGTFTEVGVAAGLGFTAAVTTMGVTTGDIDNDGFRDILILTDLGQEVLLFRNNGNGTFSRVIGPFDASTSQRNLSASFGDVNKDGLLDIYITNYITTSNVLFDQNELVNGFAHDCEPDLLFINNGDLSFSESSATYGLSQNGCGLATTFTDFDGDSDADLFVVNDFGEWVLPNFLYENQFPETFLNDVSTSLGLDTRMYGMGIAAGDYDRDGDFDYYATNIGPNFLFRNDGTSFSEVGETSGVENDSLDGLNTTSWGCFFFDYDNDGWNDLFVANGEIPAAEFIANVFFDPDKLFRNNGDGTFEDVTTVLDTISTQRGRGTAYGDLNNDGLLDIVVNNVSNIQNGASAFVYLNSSVSTNNWINIKAQGTQANRDCFGCKVRVVANGISQVTEISGGSSHASHNSSIAHFGIGETALLDSVIVYFPSGVTKVVESLTANQTIIISEDVLTGVTDLEPINPIRQLNNREFELWNGNETPFELSIYDLAGRLVVSDTEINSKFRVSSELIGIFVLEIRMPNHVYRKCISLIN